MKNFSSILLLIVLSPLLAVILLIWLMGYLVVSPFERYRYKRSPFYQQTKLNYFLLAMTNEVLRTYHTALRLGLPIEVCKSEQDYVYLKDNQGMVYIFPDTTTLIYKKNQLFIRTAKKTLIPFETGIEDELKSYSITDIKEVTLLIHKDSISDKEAFHATYQSMFKYHIYSTTKDIIQFISKDQTMDVVELRMALPNKLFLFYFAFLELLMIISAVYFLNNPISRFSVEDSIIISLLATPIMLIHILSSGVFKRIKMKYPKFIDTQWDFLFGAMLVILFFAWL
ncbi:hypothetical protein N7548_00175 [Acholeplasma manati]|uniref:Uncharacterized protein n=1 Tax=Paracholeplasma manati TaxID=591373 RepID=A0ABT2Y3D1_9MOLU|nr:hypothetical protein [Paracholeplasma manati]MCV2231241.1 hypothetical protein [Paracholeplasma manati]